MSYIWVPSGATFGFLKDILWTRPGKAGATEVVIDHGRELDDEHLHAQRVKEGYMPVNIDPFHSTDNILNRHSEWWMASAHALKGKDGRFAKKAGVNMLADSGGWQIKSGAADFLDPHKVIDIHNQCAEVGMVLDYPTHRDVDTTDESFRILARLQRYFNKIFLAERRRDTGDELGLMNVAHGVSEAQWLSYIDIVNDPEQFLGWAISQDSGRDKACIYRGAAVLYRNLGIRDQWVHLFGVSGPNMIPVVAWLGNKYFSHLTSDSSSWQGARWAHFMHLQDGALRTIKIGRENSEVVDATPLEGVCSCEFCKVMGTFGRYRQEDAYPALNGHDLIAIQATVAHWNALAAVMDRDGYRAAIEAAYQDVPDEGADGDSSESPVTKSLRHFDYLEAAMTEGPRYADKYYGL